MISVLLASLLLSTYAQRAAAEGIHPAAQRLRAPKLESIPAYPPPVNAAPSLQKRTPPSPAYTIPVFANPKAASFHVNSSALPLVTFPLQDSWAGLLPISSSASETNKLSYWYWPSSATGGSDTLTIWLNGGPGCSSFEGFLEENGPLRYAEGTKAPVLNENGWTTISDLLYIEQPVGTGFTSGTPNITNETGLANQFYGFLQQFYTVYPELLSKKLYITGESYAGFYIPYIATRILDASTAEKAKLPIKLSGLLINDGVYSSFITSAAIPAARFAAAHQADLGFTNAQVSSLATKSASCGYDAVWSQVTYPPKGKILLPNGNKDAYAKGCDLDNQLYNLAQQSNSCFNIYRVTDKCPTPNDPIEPYFSRSDVQSAIHIPNFGQWSECSNVNVFLRGDDNSAYTETLFPHLLANMPLWLWHGLDDAILMNEGDRITIQNLTWGGLQGFQTPISTPLVVNGATTGVYHAERNLTYLEIQKAGHMIPEDQPVTALHVLAAFLGKGQL